MSRRFVIGVILAAVSVSACNAARRRYQAPTPATPAGWSRDVGTPARAADADTLARWWTTFNDATLTRLITEAADANRDVRTALSRVREARAQASATRANQWPSVDLSFSGSASHTSDESTGGVSIGKSVQQSYQLGADASWEIDVFGGTRATIDAAVATAQARGADLQDVLITTTADTATQYIRVRMLQERLAIAESNAKVQAETHDIARFRYQAGLTTELDVHQARANLESTRAQIASLESERAQAIHALAILVGREPTRLDRDLATAGPIPEAALSVAIGLPADTIRRRPDVRGAERRLAAQAAQLDATRAQLYPSFGLVGSIGLETLDLAKLFVPGASFFRLTPSVSWRAFDRRQIRQNIIVQSELETQASLQYETAVLTALREAEDALVAYAQEQARRERLVDGVAAAQQAADLSLQLYNTGLRDFRDVLDAQRSLLSLQDQLASSRADVSIDLVSLYRAVAGGWSLSSPW